MQISKWHLLACAAVICGSTVAIRADDNPDQAAARAALEAKMRALSAQPANAQTSVPAASVQPAQPAAAATTPPGTDHGLFAPVPPPSGSTPSRSRVNQSSKNSQMTTAPTAAPAQKRRWGSTRWKSTMSSSDHGLFAPVPPPSSSTALERSSTNSQTLSPFTGPFFSGSSQNTNAFYPGRELGLKPITAPPLPISATQQAQLHALLNKYDANIISPEQYQAERTKILAEHK